MAINISVQYNGGVIYTVDPRLLPRGTRLNIM